MHKVIGDPCGRKTAAQKPFCEYNKDSQKAEEPRNDIMAPIKLASSRNTKCSKLVVWGLAELTWPVLEKEPLYPPGLTWKSSLQNSARGPLFEQNNW